MERRREDTSSTLPAWVTRLQTTDCLMVTDIDQHVLYWSDAAARLFDLSREDAVGRACYEILRAHEQSDDSPCCKACPMVQNALRGRPSPPSEMVATRHDGQRLALTLSLLTVVGDAESPSLLIHLMRESRRSPLARHGAELSINAFPAGRQLLSRRESEVLGLVLDGYSSSEIAARLQLSRLTVRNHLTNMQCKLGARNRVELLLCAARVGLI